MSIEMIKINLSSLFIILFTIATYSQDKYETHNYYGIETYDLFIDNSDDAEIFKDIFMDEKEINNLITYKTGLKFITPKITFTIDKTIYININYFIYKNPYSEEQYYGMYELRIFRLLKIPNSDYVTSPYAEIFSASNAFVNNYPVKSAWKKEIKEVITSLIDKFALDFRSSY